MPRRALVIALFALVAVAAFALTRERAQPLRPNILLVDIDTLTHTRVGATREGEPVTPIIDDLARRGVKFTHAFAQAGWTLPAINSTLTGSLPVPLRVAGGAMAWRARGVRDLPGILKVYGFHNVAFWGITLPGPVASLMFSGFEHVAQRTQNGRAPSTRGVVDWLKTRAQEPFFALVHEVDLHDAQAVATPGNTYRWSRPVPGNHPNYHAMHDAWTAELGEEGGREAILAHYDGVLHAYDAEIGEILDALDAAGFADSTIVVVTSDHGQDFFDHATIDHGQLYDSTLRVPLVVYDPMLESRGRTVDATVQGIDLAPTLLDRLGIPVDQTMHGHSFWPLWKGTASTREDRPMFLMSEPCHAAWRTATRKLIVRDGRRRLDRTWKPAGGANRVMVELDDFVRRHGIDSVVLPNCTPWVGGPPMHARPPGPSPGIVPGGPNDRSDGLGPVAAETADEAGPRIVMEFYDLTLDPGEMENLIEKRPEEAAELLRPLLATLAERVAAIGEAELLDEMQTAKIREQGYWGMIDPTAPPSDGTSPASTPGPAGPPPEPPPPGR